MPDPDGFVSHLRQGHLISDSTSRNACGRLTGVPRLLPLTAHHHFAPKRARGSDSSPGREAVNVALMAKVVLPMDEIMKAVA